MCSPYDTELEYISAYASCDYKGDVHLCDYAFALYLVSQFLDKLQ